MLLPLFSKTPSLAARGGLLGTPLISSGSCSDLCPYGGEILIRGGILGRPFGGSREIPPLHVKGSQEVLSWEIPEGASWDPY